MLFRSGGKARFDLRLIVWRWTRRKGHTRRRKETEVHSCAGAGWRQGEIRLETHCLEREAEARVL